MIISNPDHLFVCGINKALEVTAMLLEHGHSFQVEVYDKSPLRYILVCTDEAAAEVQALMGVI